MSVQPALQSRSANTSSKTPAAGRAAGGSSAKRPEAPLRLTRRGWLVLVVLPLMLVAALALLLVGSFISPAKASGALSVPDTVRVTVGAGQTLWDIAGSVAPDRQPREVIAEIMQLNNLQGSVIQAGQQVFVPTTR
jgi:hypothetical protein